MGAYNDYINLVKGTLSGPVPFGGTIVPTANEFPSVIAAQIKGGHFTLPTLEVLADLPLELLEAGMSITVREHVRPGGSLHPRARYYLRIVPPQIISTIVDYQIFDYWAFEDTTTASDLGDVETQYAPNYQGKKPNFLPSQISSAAYQAGYPDDATFGGGNPSDIIWVNDYDPLLNHAWFRQRIGAQPWGIPVAISAAGDYEQNQYVDVIFRWITPKGAAPPARPIQPDDYTDLPIDWQATPGVNYDVDILTMDLYRSQAIKNPYGVLKSDWELPILISSDPQLVRYGNTPGSTDFLNNTFWSGYFTPGLDTFMATRPTGVSTNWTITKIDQESGEFDDFVFKAFSIGVTLGELQAVIPTLPVPMGGDSPNDCSDAPFTVGVDEVLYMSKATKHADGSLKVGWSLWKRFDGLDNIQAVIEETPGATFSKARDAEGNLVDAFPTITLVPKLYKGPTELTTNISAYKWYRGATLIIFDIGGTRKATNLGVEFNDFHELHANDKDLILEPGAVDISQQYKIGLTHISRPTDYEDTIQIRDATDDGEAFVADIATPGGSVFKNQVGLKQFIGKFYKGGVDDDTDVVFTWSIKDSAGAAITGGLRDSGGTPIGETDVEAAEVYVQGSDIDQYATLHLTATFGEVIRTFVITLTDVQDAEAVEALYWGTGSTFPGSPTDFTPRTLTKAEVLALDIDYLEDAAGTWFVIYRIGGIWGGEIQMRSESARPNGGISLTIFKNIEDGVDPVPPAPAVPGTGSIVPAGWTIAPTDFAGSEDLTYVTSCIFLLRTDVDADPSVLTRDNYNPLGTYGTPKEFSSNAAPPVEPGERGWSPVFAVIADGTRRVLQLVAWVDGEGTPPAGAGGSNSYVGAAGLTSLANAVDIRGPQGEPAAGIIRPQSVYSSGSQNTIPNIALTAANSPVALNWIVVHNTTIEPRWYKIRGIVGFQETDTADLVEVYLYQRNTDVALDPLPFLTPENNFNPATRAFVFQASTRQRIDHNGAGASATDNQMLTVEILALIPAGEKYSFTAVVAVDSGGTLRNLGYIEAYGL